MQASSGECRAVRRRRRPEHLSVAQGQRLDDLGPVAGAPLCLAARKMSGGGDGVIGLGGGFARSGLLRFPVGQVEAEAPALGQDDARSITFSSSRTLPGQPYG